MRNRTIAPISGILAPESQNTNRAKRFNQTYATPRIIGIVNVDELTGFSHCAELLPAAHVLPEDELDVVAALRGSTTLSGTAILIIDSILPIMSRSVAAIRAPSVTILTASLSMSKRQTCCQWSVGRDQERRAL